MDIGKNREEMLGTVLAVLLKRAGGQLSISQDELDEVEGTKIIAEENDKAGLLAVHLIPDYIQIGVDDAEAEAQAERDAELAKSLKLPYGNSPFPYSNGTITLNGTNLSVGSVGTVGTFQSSNTFKLDPTVTVKNGDTVSWNANTTFKEL